MGRDIGTSEFYYKPTEREGSCDNEAEIFHDEGDFCVYCWNEIKETPPPS